MCLLIGRGPDHSLASSIFLMVFGVLFGWAAFNPGTRVRGAFMYGKGPSVPVSRAERVILVLVALVMIIFGVRDLVR